MLPRELIDGPLTVLAPHMDDEVLGCGGMLAAIAASQPIHVVYVTDGAGSPVPPAPWIGHRSADLSRVRAREAVRAMEELGIPAQQLRFLDLPDGGLRKREVELRDRLAILLDELKPSYLLVPFRFDRHRDHLATNRAAMAAVESAGRDAPSVLEYFVYYRSRLIPRGDLRQHLRPERLAVVDVSQFSAQKHRALESYESQTTLFFEWQRRPNLTRQFLDEVVDAPEMFAMHFPTVDSPRIFLRWERWVRFAQAIEHPLKQVKDRAIAIAGALLPHMPQ